jgi:hypothetical protein
MDPQSVSEGINFRKKAPFGAAISTSIKFKIHHEEDKAVNLKPKQILVCD